MTFQLAIMLELSLVRFLATILNLLIYFWYVKLLGIFFMSFLAAILNWNFRFSVYGLQTFRDQKSPLSFCTFK